MIATGRGGPGSDFSIGANTPFTCLHTDSTGQVAPEKQTTPRQLFWFVEGTLDDLLGRFRRDFPAEPRRGL